jgi:hypothetical protein
MISSPAGPLTDAPTPAGIHRASRALHDLVILIAIGLLTLVASFWVDPFARLIAWIYSHDNWKLDELCTLAIVLVVCLAIYAWRRWREFLKEIRNRRLAQEQNRMLSATLETTMNEMRALRGILRICESCQRILDGSHSWVSLELYLEATSKARFTHGLCPECARKIYKGRAREGLREGDHH